MKFELSRQIFEKTSQMSSFIKIRLVAAESLHEDLQMDGQKHRQTDRQTDKTKLTAAFLNFANAPTKK